MSEKPLPVRVAERLGHKTRRLGPCTSCVQLAPDGGGLSSAVERPHYHWEMWVDFKWAPTENDWRPTPRYDIDWSVTGPLIEQHGIELGRFRDGGRVAYGGHEDGEPQVDARGETYLIAVCELILKLPKEDRL